MGVGVTLVPFTRYRQPPTHRAASRRVGVSPTSIPDGLDKSPAWEPEEIQMGEEIERRANNAKLILETATKHRIPVEMLWKHHDE